MAIIVSYDVGENKTLQFKQEMKKLGYDDSFLNSSTNETTKLPNTTLYHHTKTPSEAITDLKAVGKTVGATVDKAVSIAFGSGWSSIPSK